MKANRTKRMAGLTGLLMALTLTATGCSLMPTPSQPSAVPIVAPPTPRVGDFDPSMTLLDAEWEAAFGQDRAVSTPIAATGIKILSIMFDDHPEYTLGGFVPTDAEFNVVAAKFAPLANPQAMEYMDSQWRADKTLPVMTSYRTKLDENGLHGYTYTTEAGEKCTDGDKPYEYKMEGVSLTSRPDQSGNQVPVFTGNINLTVQCKEGTLLQGQMYGWFPMQEVNGKWIILDTYEVMPAAAFTVTPAAG